MAETPKDIDLQECENLIKQIRDVISVNIVMGEDKKIEEIHVLAEENRNAKQLVRDIETLLRVEYGIELDHKKISIVQLQKGQNITRDKRVKINAISYSLQGNQLEAIVELASAKKTCQGRSVGINSRRNNLRLFAEATLEAVNGFLEDGITLTLEDVAPFSLGSKNIMTTAVTLLREGVEEYLIGSAVIKQDEREAVVRATLGAINRRVPFA
ncbi:MAG: hypothetical protein GX200_09875 [Firmicutes bacterium]|nr:hypothetical protein [Bacillota bacterium]